MFKLHVQILCYRKLAVIRLQKCARRSCLFTNCRSDFKFVALPAIFEFKHLGGGSERNKK